MFYNDLIGVARDMIRPPSGLRDHSPPCGCPPSSAQSPLLAARTAQPSREAKMKRRTFVVAAMTTAADLRRRVNYAGGGPSARIGRTSGGLAIDFCHFCRTGRSGVLALGSRGRPRTDLPCR